MTRGKAAGGLVVVAGCAAIAGAILDGRPPVEQSSLPPPVIPFVAPPAQHGVDIGDGTVIVIAPRTNRSLPPGVNRWIIKPV